jgi:hypothetical protein
MIRCERIAYPPLCGLMISDQRASIQYTSRNKGLPSTDYARANMLLTRGLKSGHGMGMDQAARLLKGGGAPSRLRGERELPAKAYGPLPGSTRVCAPNKGMPGGGGHRGTGSHRAGGGKAAILLNQN